MGSQISRLCKWFNFQPVTEHDQPKSVRIAGPPPETYLLRQKTEPGRHSNPAANALSPQLRSDINALPLSVSNIESDANFVLTAEGGLAVVTDLVNQESELAIQSSNGTLNDSQRESLNQEFSQIQNEIDRLTDSLQFNGQNLVDGTWGKTPTRLIYSGRRRMRVGKTDEPQYGGKHRHSIPGD